jgi:hypothetical protein
VLTGGTTLATALVLSFFAGEVIKPFALCDDVRDHRRHVLVDLRGVAGVVWITQRWGAEKTPRRTAVPVAVKAECHLLSFRAKGEARRRFGGSLGMTASY